MSQTVKITHAPTPREITPRNGRNSFIAYEQVAYVHDQETGRQQDVLLRVENAQGYAPGTYKPRPPKLVRGDFDNAAWERKVQLDLVAEHSQNKPRAVNA